MNSAMDITIPPQQKKLIYNTRHGNNRKHKDRLDQDKQNKIKIQNNKKKKKGTENTLCEGDKLIDFFTE